MTRPPRAIRWSVRLYALLLLLLPTPFRREYGESLLQTFRDLCGDRLANRGPVGLLGVWGRVLPDLLAGGVGERVYALRSGGIGMQRPSLSWLAGLAVVLCIVLLWPGLMPPRAIVFVGIIALVLAAVVLTLRRRRVPAADGGLALVGASQVGSLTQGLDGAVASSARSLLCGLVAVLAALFVALVAYVVVTYPDALAPGNPARTPLVLRWLGAGRAGLVDLFIAALIVGGYAATAVFGTREPRDAAVRPWLTGAALGAGAGLLIVLIGVATDLTARTAAESATSARATVLLAFAAAVASGVVVGKASGQASLAALGGFWAGLVTALLLATGGLAGDVLLAARLVNTVWAAGLDCPGLHGSALAACSIGDALGGLANALFFLPTYAAGLGLFGGLVGRALAVRRASAEGVPAILAPVLCATLLLAIFATKVGGIW